MREFFEYQREALRAKEEEAAGTRGGASTAMGQRQRRTARRRAGMGDDRQVGGGSERLSFPRGADFGGEEEREQRLVRIEGKLDRLLALLE